MRNSEPVVPRRIIFYRLALAFTQSIAGNLIIMLRDGVSEGQFKAVGEHEVQQIKCEPSPLIICCQRTGS
jgi:hypothetical protein